MQQKAESSGEVTIEQGESKGLSVFRLEFNDVFRVFDVKGVCLRLFVLVQATNNTPSRLLPAGKGGPGPR